MVSSWFFSKSVWPLCLFYIGHLGHLHWKLIFGMWGFFLVIMFLASFFVFSIVWLLCRICEFCTYMCFYDGEFHPVISMFRTPLTISYSVSLVVVNAFIYLENASSFMKLSLGGYKILGWLFFLFVFFKKAKHQFLSLLGYKVSAKKSAFSLMRFSL